MKCSDKLNGFWEEGYHYYFEIDKDKLTVRDYRRAITLVTRISYDADALERGETTLIKLDDNVLSRTASGEPFTMIRTLSYENGELKLLYYYTIMGETLYTLKKVDHGPFDHIKIRDEEFLKQLQGKWYKWNRNGDSNFYITIKGNNLSIFDAVEPFHVVSYTYSPDKVMIIPENLIDQNFRGFTAFEVLPGMLTSRALITDVSVPLSVFVRKGNLKTVEVPYEATLPIVNTMVPRVDEV